MARKNNKNTATKKQPKKHEIPSIPPDQKIESLLLTVPEVCSLLGGISRSTLSRLEKSGQLPGRVKLGGSVRYHRESISDWLKESAQKAINQQ